MSGACHICGEDFKGFAHWCGDVHVLGDLAPDPAKVLLRACAAVCRGMEEPSEEVLSVIGPLRDRAEKAERERDAALAAHMKHLQSCPPLQIIDGSAWECGTLRGQVAKLREALLQWKYYWTDPRGLEDARAIKADGMTDAALKETE